MVLEKIGRFANLCMECRNKKPKTPIEQHFLRFLSQLTEIKAKIFHLNSDKLDRTLKIRSILPFLQETCLLTLSFLVISLRILQKETTLRQNLKEDYLQKNSRPGSQRKRQSITRMSSSSPEYKPWSMKIGKRIPTSKE